MGIAIAFAAQSLLKDFFNGFFIMLEDRYGVGDFVVINDMWGAVNSLGLRITTLQVWTGEIVITSIATSCLFT
ncbi:mechanosensitive ion channel domain-containing protein [Virgibacillus phasianinus]|uniref:mechanosensitive ion channel domain-containing protein n=1 Tax=Virgibacillus phasianinus TaxID=2017483 RepID=UPI003183568A